MIYRKNMGRKEQAARVAVGVLAAACALSLAGPTPLGLTLAGSGIAFALTGFFGFCPACAAVGRGPAEPGR